MYPTAAGSSSEGAEVILVSGDIHTRSNHWLKGRCSKGFCHSAEITSKQIDCISGEKKRTKCAS